MKALIGVRRSAADPDEREEALRARLSALGRALDDEPAPAWREDTRARLVAMAAVRRPEPAPVSPLGRLLARGGIPRGVWRTRLTAGLAGAAAGVTGLAVVAAMAADARPGDALYGVKRGTEQTQLALAGDARGRTLLGFASARMEELSVVLSGETSVDVVADTLATMDAQTVDGAAWLAERAADSSSSAPLDELAGWSAGQSAILAALDPTLPPAARDDAADSAELLARIDERIEALRAALACPGGPATDGADDLGPRPAPCPPAPAPVEGEDPEPPPAGLPGTVAVPPAVGTSEEATGSGTSAGPSGAGGSTGSADPSGSPGAPTSAPGDGSGGSTGVVPSGEAPPAPQSLPLPAPVTPGQPLPDVDLSTPSPDPGGASRPQSGTSGGSSPGGSSAGASSAGSSPAASSAGSSSPEGSVTTGAGTGPGVCPSGPLPVTGDC